MNVCINPSCSNVECFDGDCPMCHAGFSISCADYIHGVNELDSCIATIHRYDLNNAEHTLFDNDYRLTQ